MTETALVPKKDNISIGPVELVVLQGTPFCNLNCSYCYLTENSRRDKSIMAISLIDTIFDKILSSQYVGHSLRVSWHSGEPLVLGPSYYRQAIDTVLKIKTTRCSSDFNIHFDIQTNGTLINQEWCDFFNEYSDLLSVGVSCDGPSFLHDAYRKNWAEKPTHKLTQAGMHLLCENNIKFDLIAVVSLESLDHPIQFIDFFTQYTDHIQEFHFNLHDEIIPQGDENESLKIYAKKYDFFLNSLLNTLSEDSALCRPKIRNFSSFYNMLFSKEDKSLYYDARSMSRPFKSLTFDTKGNVSTFYAGLTADECIDLYKDGCGLIVGNILEHDLDQIAASSKLKKIADDFEQSHQVCEAECDYYGLCSGGYNLIKFKRFGKFDVAETPECYVHVKTFARILLDELNRSIDLGQDNAF